MLVLLVLDNKWAALHVSRWSHTMVLNVPIIYIFPQGQIEIYQFRARFNEVQYCFYSWMKSINLLWINFPSMREWFPLILCALCPWWEDHLQILHLLCLKWSPDIWLESSLHEGRTLYFSELFRKVGLTWVELVELLLKVFVGLNKLALSFPQGTEICSSV